jgi:hypothetical protein
MAEPITHEYSFPSDQAFNIALQAVRRLGCKISSIDKVNGLLQFKTQMSWKSWAGQDMSILVLDNGNGTCTVDITGTRNASGLFVQAYDWGEAGGIAKQVFAEMDKLFKK